MGACLGLGSNQRRRARQIALANAAVNFAAATKRVFLTFSANEIQDKGQIFARANYLALN